MKKQNETRPLFQRVLIELRDSIRRDHKAGDRLATDVDMAKQMNVSVATVRDALRVLAREGLIDRRRRTGTVVRDPFIGRHLAVISALDIFDRRVASYFPRMIRQLELGLQNQGLSVRLYIDRVLPAEFQAGTFDCPSFWEDFNRERIRAVVSPIGFPFGREQLRNIEAAGVAIIPSPRSGEPSVGLDYPLMIRQMIKRLADQGRKRIAAIFSGPGLNAPKHMDPFRPNIEASLYSMGLRVESNWIRTEHHAGMTGSGWESFLELWTVRSDLKPDGLIIGDEGFFNDVSRAILKLGIRVPEDLAVVAHGTRGDASEAPFPFTRWEVDPEAIGLRMAEIVADIIQGNASPAAIHAPQPRIVEVRSQMTERLQQLRVRSGSRR